MFIDWHYCKFCIGTGEYPKGNHYSSCRKCQGSGMVPASIWKHQKHTMGGGKRHKAGYGRVPPHEIETRLETSFKPRLLSSLVSWRPFKLKEFKDVERQ